MKAAATSPSLRAERPGCSASLRYSVKMAAVLRFSMQLALSLRSKLLMMINVAVSTLFVVRSKRPFVRLPTMLASTVRWLLVVCSIRKIPTMVSRHRKKHMVICLRLVSSIQRRSCVLLSKMLHLLLVF